MTRQTIHLTGLLLITSILLLLTFLTTAQDTDFSCDDAQHPIECEALVAIYNTTGGEGWDDRDGWLEDADVCVWYGITCDDGGQVSKIELGNSGLIGDLPPEIGNLSNLQVLNVAGNELTSLPAEIGDLTNLRVLSLGECAWAYVCFGNPITSLPPEIGNLSNLEILSVRGNALMELPAEIGNLTSLKEISAGNNMLIDLPPEIYNLSSLQVLNVGGNPLDCIPENGAHLVEHLPLCEALQNPSGFFCPDAQYPNECEALITMYEATTKRAWDIVWGRDADICKWSGITCNNDGRILRINLIGAGLEGDLPPQIGELTHLETLWFHDNLITSLPQEIGNLTNLQLLDMSANVLVSLPPEIGSLSSLKLLNVRGNNLFSLPLQIGELSNLESLNIRDNSLTSLPPEIGNLSNLEWLDVQGNPLTCIPEGVAHLVDDLPVCEE